MTDNPPKSLAAKMAAIMGEVSTMTRDGTNAAQKYNFTTAEQVKAALRPLLKKHKVALFANMLDLTRETSTNKNGTAVVTVMAKMCFTLVCGDTGETVECIWFGEANDYADKATNKAATAALKYFLTNTFLLSTTDPDADEDAVYTVAGAAPNILRDAEPERMTSDQYTKINALGKQVYGQGWPAAAKQLVMKHTGERTAKATEMTVEEAEELFDALLQIQAAAKQPVTP